MSKKKLRIELKSYRAQLSEKQVDFLSKKICELIEQIDLFKQAKKVAIYLPFSKEVSLLPLLNNNKNFYVPVLQQDLSLKFFPFNLGELTCPNQFAIQEPLIQNKAANPNTIDIILLPVLGFTKHGQRLGMGKGCYDRTLHQINKPILIGVAYSFQELSDLIQESHDIQLDMIITEKQIFYTSSRIEKLLNSNQL